MSVDTYSNGQLANGTRRSWISLTAFNSDFFSYATSINPTTFETTGALSAVTGATALTCPTARILRENGKKLYPSAHNGVNTYMVGVFDPVSFLSGFIDPNNNSVFAVYNNDKPASLDTSLLAGGVNPNGGGADVSEIVSVGQVRSSTVIPLSAVTNTGSATINPVLGQVFTISTAANASWAFTFNAASAAAGSRITIIIIASTASTTTFTFGTNMLSAGTLATASGAFTISFISDGTNFYEVGRTGAQA